MTPEEAKAQLELLQAAMIADGATYTAEALELAMKALDICEVWNGVHGQVVAPKGTFDKIWEDCKDEDTD